jgi:DASS family divalent anion:Na+ symporter
MVLEARLPGSSAPSSVPWSGLHIVPGLTYQGELVRRGRLNLPVTSDHLLRIRETMSSERPQLTPFLLTLTVGIIIWFSPIPTGVNPKAWHLLAIFVATVVGIIAKPLPMGAVALLGIAMTALTNTLTINEALSGFGNSVIWLIVVAFFISRGFIKTGLGARIAYLFMSAFGKSLLAWPTA